MGRGSQGPQALVEDVRWFGTASRRGGFQVVLQEPRLGTDLELKGIVLTLRSRRDALDMVGRKGLAVKQAQGQERLGEPVVWLLGGSGGEINAAGCPSCWNPRRVGRVCWNAQTESWNARF